MLPRISLQLSNYLCEKCCIGFIENLIQATNFQPKRFSRWRGEHCDCTWCCFPESKPLGPARNCLCLARICVPGYTCERTIPRKEELSFMRDCASENEVVAILIWQRFPHIMQLWKNLFLVTTGQKQSKIVLRGRHYSLRFCLFLNDFVCFWMILVTRSLLNQLRLEGNLQTIAENARTLAEFSRMRIY